MSYLVKSHPCIQVVSSNTTHLLPFLDRNLGSINKKVLKWKTILVQMRRQQSLTLLHDACVQHIFPKGD